MAFRMLIHSYSSEAERNSIDFDRVSTLFQVSVETLVTISNS